VKNIASVSDIAEDVSGYIKKAESEGIVPILRSGRAVALKWTSLGRLAD
jgi:hypothetical protein